MQILFGGNCIYIKLKKKILSKIPDFPHLSRISVVIYCVNLVSPHMYFLEYTNASLIRSGHKQTIHQNFHKNPNLIRCKDWFKPSLSRDNDFPSVSPFKGHHKTDIPSGLVEGY